MKRIPTLDVQALQITIPEQVQRAVAETVGGLVAHNSDLDPEATARDILNVEVRRRAASILARYTKLQGKRLLDVGSGFGLALAVLVKEFEADAYGIEPDGVGFSSSLQNSKLLLEANGIAPGRAVLGSGEEIPFPNDHFDIVYSSNSLEHTNDPARVLNESLRVLRPGGVLHFEIPNFMSYWEGHYMIPIPPIIFRSLLPWWVKVVFRRDPSFAKTLQPINPIWLRKEIKKLSREYPIRTVSLGEDLFLQRLKLPFVFNGELQAPLKPVIGLIQKLNFGNWIGHSIVAVNGFYPIFLTLEKLA